MLLPVAVNAALVVVIHIPQNGGFCHHQTMKFFHSAARTSSEGSP
jgi:hypothetical protein